MTQHDDRDQQISDLRGRLTRLSEAGRLINESLDLDAVLRSVVDSARILTGSRFAVILTCTDQNEIDDFVVSGMTDEQTKAFRDMPNGRPLVQYLHSQRGPLRVDDFAAHVIGQGLPAFQPAASDERRRRGPDSPPRRRHRRDLRR